MKKSNILFFLVLLLMAASGTKAQTYTDVSTFADLQAAVSDGARIRLTSNITFTQQITINNGVKVVIDGNGKTLTGSSCRAFLVNSSAVLSLKNVTINAFDLNAGGGAFRNYGTLVFDGCTISNNHTDGSSQGGGAIENGSGAKLYASNTVFSNNYSSEIGGAINNYGGCLYLGGCTFTNNYTTSINARYGGAIGVNGGSEVRIVNCTFSGNKYGTNQGASDLGVYSNAQDYTIAGCPGIVIQSNSSVVTHDYGGATPDFSDLDHLEFDFTSSDEPLIVQYDLTLAEGSDAHGTVAFIVGGTAATKAEVGDVVTVSVTPAEGFSTKNVFVNAYTSWSAGSRSNGIGLLDEIEVTKNTENGTWQFVMPEASVCVQVTYAKNLQDAWVQPIADISYTGEALEPVITVQDGTTVLSLNTHYTVAYANNVNAGTANVTVTAVEGSDYSGTAHATFNILKADITAVTPPTLKEVFYTGEAQALIEIGSATGGEMQYSLDGETYSTAVPTAVETGNYTIYYKVVGDGNHNDVAPQTIIATILRAEDKLLAELYEALGDDVWTGYGTTSGVISYSRGDGPKEFKATFMGGAYTITVPFDDVVSAEKVDNGDGSFTYTLVVNLPAETGMASETLHVTMKNGEITELESENTGISMGKETGDITTWTELQTAIGNGGVIKLSQDITAGSTDEALTVPAGKTVVLDLNGFILNRALTSAVANGSVMVVNGTLAIMDGVGTGVITGGNTTGNGGGILNNGTVTLYGGEISGNHADGLGGGVYNTATNTDTEGFWMTGGLIDANTASSYPAIGGEVTFNNLAVVQIDADGTTLSAKTAKAGLATFSYIMPVMPDSEKFGILAELYNALGDDVWTGYGTSTGVISYSQGDELNEFKATFMGGTYTITVPFGDVVSADKVDNGDGSFSYTLVVNLPAETGLASETLHVTMRNGEITELESENTGISMGKETGDITTWTELQTAIGNGGVIKLSQDITAGSTDEALTVPAGKTVVLDLNGFTLNRALTGAVDNGSVIVNNGTLAIMDGVGTGIITGGNTTGSGGGILNNGTVTLYGGEITGNHADGFGGGVFNSVMNTDTEGFWMTGGLIDANTADIYPAIGGEVTFNDMAFVQVDADGTTVNVPMALDNMANISYIKPVMPDNDMYALLLMLGNAIDEAVAYYSSIRDTNPDSAAPLSNAIAEAQHKKETYGATQAEIENAITALNEAVEAAKADVALKRITISIPAKKSFVARIDADKRQIEHAVDGVSLYTVKSVSDTEVRLTTELSVVAAEMPYLIYNDNDENVSVSIVLSSNDADEVEYDSEHFKGTLIDKTFTDEDMEEADYYLLSNGHQFVKVMGAGTLGAGKCWIELPHSMGNARSLNIVFEDGETTGVTEAWKQNEEKPASVYDLQGRRISQPTRGLYIINGKKVVVK